MDILHLLDRLETVLTSGARIPLSGKTMVDEHECLDIIDQLRVAIPEEVKHARRLQADRERLLVEAQEQAARIVAHAQEQASVMADQHELVVAAETKAQRILEEADADANDRREGADQYSVETLADLERHLSELLTVVKNGIKSLSSTRDGRESGGDR